MVLSGWEFCGLRGIARDVDDLRRTYQNSYKMKKAELTGHGSMSTTRVFAYRCILQCTVPCNFDVAMYNTADSVSGAIQ
jgi:hypothetical protein